MCFPSTKPNKRLTTIHTRAQLTVIVDDGDARNTWVPETPAPRGVLEDDVEVYVRLVLVIVDDRYRDQLPVLVLVERLQRTSPSSPGSLTSVCSGLTGTYGFSVHYNCQLLPSPVFLAAPPPVFPTAPPFPSLRYTPSPVFLTTPPFHSLPYTPSISLPYTPPFQILPYTLPFPSLPPSPSLPKSFLQPLPSQIFLTAPLPSLPYRPSLPQPSLHPLPQFSLQTVPSLVFLTPSPSLPYSHPLPQSFLHTLPFPVFLRDPLFPSPPYTPPFFLTDAPFPSLPYSHPLPQSSPKTLLSPVVLTAYPPSLVFLTDLPFPSLPYSSPSSLQTLPFPVFFTALLSQVFLTAINPSLHLFSTKTSASPFPITAIYPEECISWD